MAKTVLRYWGSYIKRPAVSIGLAQLYAPARAAGWRIVLVMSQFPEQESWLDPLRGVIDQVYLPRPQGQYDVACIRRTQRLCQEVRPDVFHCDNMHTSPMIGAWLAGVPARFWTKRSMDDYFEQMRPPTLRERVALSTRITARLSTRVLAVSAGVKKGLVSAGVPTDKIIVFNNPRPGTRRATKSRDEARAILGYGPTELVVAAIGHSIPVKAWDVLIEAFAPLAREMSAARLLLVGSTTGEEEAPFQDRLEGLMDRHAVRDRVRFPGYMTDPTIALSAADIFVLPSLSEGNASALVEALEMGLPCIATPVGAATEFIRSGENGFLVARRNAEELSTALRALAHDPKLRSAFAATSRDHLRVPTYPEYAEELHRIYVTFTQTSARSAGASSEKGAGAR